MVKVLKYFDCWKEFEVTKKKIDSTGKEKIIKRIEIIDVNTKKRYRKFKSHQIALKIVLLLLFNPIVATLKVAFNFLQMGFDFVYVFLDSSIEMADDMKNGKIFKVIKSYIISKVDLCQYIVEDIVNIIKAPFLALLVQFSCVVCIYSFNTGRKMISRIENIGNFEKGLEYDYRNNKTFLKKNILVALFETLINRERSIVFHLAPCLQPMGKLSDKNIISYKEIKT